MYLIDNIRIDYNKTSIQAKASVWYAGCSLLNKMIQFITIPIFTRLLTTLEYGTYTLFLSWQSIFLMIISLNIQSNIFYNLLIKDSNNEESSSSTLSYISMIAMIAILVYLTHKKLIDNLIQLSSSIILSLVLISVLTSAYDLWAMVERFNFRYKKLVRVSVATIIANPLIGLAFVFLTKGDRGEARIFSVVVTQILFYSALYFIIMYKGKKIIDTQKWKYVSMMAIPLLPHYLSQTLLNQSTRIVISKIIGTDYAAIYSVAYSVAIIMMFVNKAINDSFTPWIYKRLKEGNLLSINKIANILVMFIALLNIILMLVGPEIIKILAPSSYSKASIIIPPVAASSFLIFIYGLFCNVEFYYEMKIQILSTSVCGAIINIVLNFLLIPVYGFVAAGYTTLISYIFFVTTHYLVMRRAEKKYLNGGSIYNVKLIFLISIIVIVSTVTINLILYHFFARYTILTILLILTCIIIHKKRDLLFGA